MQGGPKRSIYDPAQRMLQLQACEAHRWHQQNHEDAIFHIFLVTQVPNNSIRPYKGSIPLNSATRVNDEHVQVVVLFSICCILK